MRSSDPQESLNIPPVANKERQVGLILHSQEPIPKGYSLDRIDNDGPYAPWNCKFSSPTEQVQNRRKNMANLRDKYRIAVLGLMKIDKGDTSISARSILDALGHEFDFLLKETRS